MLLEWIVTIAFVSAPCDLPFAIEPSTSLPSFPEATLKAMREDGVALFSGQEAGAGTRYIKALVLFDASADETMKLLTQTARQVEYLPLLKRATVLEHQSHENVEKHEVKAGLFTVVYQMRHHWNMSTRQIWWCLNANADNDLKVARGYWRIYPLDSTQSIGEYGTHVDVGTAVPQFLQDFAVRKDVPKALNNQRLWVNSGGTFKYKS